MSARLRLTLSYAIFLLIAGVGLLAVVFYLVRFVPDGNLDLSAGFVPNRDDLLEAVWPRIWQVLLALAVIGFVGGWFLAGYMLRPLQKINEVARQVAAGSLDHRVHLGGQADEFRELADTFDSMLERLQVAFEEQRRFSANASHELRTPYAITRSILDVALADPDNADIGLVLSRLDATNRRGIETVEALLALSALDHGTPLGRSPVDLAEVVNGVVEELRPLAVEADVTIVSRIGEGDLDGDEALVRQLVSNLVLNGIRHNLEHGGSVEITTSTGADDTVLLSIQNTGPVVPPELLTTLTEPFVRGAGRESRHPSPRGSGRGLAIVARIAQAHGAVLDLRGRPSGGLQVTVRFAAPTAG